MFIIRWDTATAIWLQYVSHWLTMLHRALEIVHILDKSSLLFINILTFTSLCLLCIGNFCAFVSMSQVPMLSESLSLGYTSFRVAAEIWWPSIQHWGINSLISLEILQQKKKNYIDHTQSGHTLFAFLLTSIFHWLIDRVLKYF